MREPGILELLVLGGLVFFIAVSWTQKDAEHEMNACEFEWMKQEQVFQSFQELRRWGDVPSDEKSFSLLLEREAKALADSKLSFTRMCMIVAGFKPSTDPSYCGGDRSAYSSYCWKQKRWWN